MGFLFPLFLIAGVVLIIPILIHLFNLRRYKHVFFPNTRFLQQLQIASKKSAQLQKKWLLLTRLLFLSALILAFAKPYLFSSQNDIKSKSIKVLYIDNSLSMLAKKGQESLLQQAKNQAIQFIESGSKEGRFLVWSNAKMSSMRPLEKTIAIQEVTEIKPSPIVVDANRILGNLLATQENEPNENWSVYLFSDFQKSTFLTAKNQVTSLKNTQLTFVPFQVSKLANLFIDTAYFYNPSLEDNQDNQLIVQVKKSGDLENNASSLRVQIGDQTRAVTKIEGFNTENIWRDTINISLASGWQKVTLSLNDFPLSFDDTFRMALQPVANLSVLVIGEGVMEAHLQTAFSSYKGFQVQWQSVSSLNPNMDLEHFSLIVLQNMDNLPENLIQLVKSKLENGGTVLLFPGNAHDKSNLNRTFQTISDISFGAFDSTKQQVSSLQENQPLIKDLFDRIPPNIQLPVVSKRFPIQSGLNANQQSIMNFKDGTPFLAQYAVEKGKLFLFAMPLDVQSSDFPLSYFFVPLLYKMAIQSQGENPAAIRIGDPNPVWIKAAADRNKRSVWHLKASDFDAVPVQKPSGSGIDVFLGQVNTNPGFYILQQEDRTDSILVALNANRIESEIEYASKKEVEQNLEPLKMDWFGPSELSNIGWKNQQGAFPLWKVCVLIALLCLGMETYLLFQKKKVTEP